MAFCGNCGANVDNNVKFCPNCGAQMAAPQQMQQQYQPEYQQPYQQQPYGQPQQFEQNGYEQYPPQGQYGEPEYDAPPAANGGDFQAKLEAVNNTPDSTKKFSKKDIEQNKVMAILAYFGPLVFIPMFAAKDSRFARYHTNQGLVLLLASIAYSFATFIVTFILTLIWWRLSFVGSILNFLSIVFFLLAVLGIINAANGKAKELPIIGKIKLLK